MLSKHTSEVNSASHVLCEMCNKIRIHTRELTIVMILHVALEAPRKFIFQFKFASVASCRRNKMCNISLEFASSTERNMRNEFSSIIHALNFTTSSSTRVWTYSTELCPKLQPANTSFIPLFSRNWLCTLSSHGLNSDTDSDGFLNQ